MSVAKLITIIGSSSESFAKTADAAAQEAAKTLRGITGADIVSMSATVENERIAEYGTTVNIAFAVERWRAAAALVIWRRGPPPGTISAVAEAPIIEREEVVTLLFALLDIKQELIRIRKLLQDGDDEQEG